MPPLWERHKTCTPPPSSTHTHTQTRPEDKTWQQRQNIIFIRKLLIWSGQREAHNRRFLPSEIRKTSCKACSLVSCMREYGCALIKSANGVKLYPIADSAVHFARQLSIVFTWLVCNGWINCQKSAAACTIFVFGHSKRFPFFLHLHTFEIRCHELYSLCACVRTSCTTDVTLPRAVHRRFFRVFDIKYIDGDYSFMQFSDCEW